MLPLLLLSLTITLGIFGYTQLISDIKKGEVNEKNLVNTNRTHYWILLFFVAGLTTISVNTLQVMWNKEFTLWLKVIIGTMLMIMYFFTFIIQPSRYFIKKYKK